MKYIGFCILFPVLILPWLQCGTSIPKQEAIVSADPQDPEQHVKLGNAYYDKSVLDDTRFDEELLTKALAEYKRALELNTDLAAAHGKIGLIHKDLGRLDDAKRELERALDLEPGLKEEKKALAVIYYNEGVQAASMHDYATGIKSFKRVLELDPAFTKAELNMAIAYYNLATASIKTGDYKGGIDKLEKALAIDPGYQEAEENLRVAYARWGTQCSHQGNYDKAIMMFTQSLDIGKDDEVKKNLAVACCKKALTLHKQDMKGAIDLYKKAIRCCPDKNDKLVANAKNNIVALKQRLKK